MHPPASVYQFHHQWKTQSLKFICTDAYNAETDIQPISMVSTPVYHENILITHASKSFTISYVLGYEAGLSDIINLPITIGNGIFTDSRDQSEYVYVAIGDQCWMAENFRFLPAVHDYSDFSDSDPRFYVMDIGEAIRMRLKKILFIKHLGPSTTIRQLWQFVRMAGICRQMQSGKSSKKSWE